MDTQAVHNIIICWRSDICIYRDYTYSLISAGGGLVMIILVMQV